MVLESSEINSETVLELIEGRITALRVRQFITQDLAARLTQAFLSSPRLSHYPGNGDSRQIGCWGIPFVSAEPTVAEEYFASAESSMQEQRSLCAPAESPIDCLIADLNRIWPAGASLQKLGGRRMFAGLVRQFDEGIGARPHQDRIDWAAPDSLEVKGLRSQIAANVYLKTSVAGGELQLWDTELSGPEYSARRLPQSYGLDRDKLPMPTCVISPDVGELILFRASHVHAVAAPVGGMRIAMSSFIGFWGRGRALGVWS